MEGEGEMRDKGRGVNVYIENGVKGEGGGEDEGRGRETKEVREEEETKVVEEEEEEEEKDEGGGEHRPTWRSSHP